MNCPHCETELDEHEANRCLDAWVAEAVMGELALMSPSPIYVGRFDWVMKGDWYVARENESPYRVPYYSTSIAAAWEVVERSGILDHTENVLWRNPRAQKYFWHYGYNQEFYSEILKAETAPLAICRAALKAAGGE